MKKYYEVKIPHGWNKGWCKQKDIICTTDSGIDKWHTLLGENMELENYRIRKLTPKECWRLMGQKDEDFEKARQVNSESQLYKQAGNSIVVDVLEAIFKEML